MNNRNEDKVDPAEDAQTTHAVSAGITLKPGSMVYVKAVDSSQVEGLNGVPPGVTLYAIHSDQGAPLAVLGNRDAAFYAARQHNMLPMSVH